MVKRWCVMVLAGAAVLGAAGAAEACTCIGSCPVILLESESSIPANAPGFILATYGWEDTGEARPSWIVTDMDRAVVYPTATVDVSNVPGDFVYLASWKLHLIQTEHPLEPGRYVISSPDSTCGLDFYPDETSIVHIKEEVELPTELGSISRSAPLVDIIPVHPTDPCVDFEYASYLDFSVDFSEVARPWKDILFFTTIVDGERWQVFESNACLRPPLGAEPGGRRGTAQIFTLCDGSGVGLEPGRHTVKFMAWLPGTDIVLETEEAEFELDCTELEAQLAAANPSDGAPDEGKATSAGEEADGCNVAAPSGSTSGGWLGLGLAGLGVWAGLRRR